MCPCVVFVASLVTAMLVVGGVVMLVMTSITNSVGLLRWRQAWKHHGLSRGEDLAEAEDFTPMLWLLAVDGWDTAGGPY